MTHAVVDVIANAISIQIGLATASTFPYSIQFVAIAIAITGRDSPAAAFIDLARAIAHTARVVRAYTRIKNVAEAIVVKVFFAGASTHANCVVHVSLAVAIAGRNV